MRPRTATPGCQTRQEQKRELVGRRRHHPPPTPLPRQAKSNCMYARISAPAHTCELGTWVSEKTPDEAPRVAASIPSGTGACPPQNHAECSPQRGSMRPAYLGSELGEERARRAVDTQSCVHFQGGMYSRRIQRCGPSPLLEQLLAHVISHLGQFLHANRHTSPPSGDTVAAEEGNAIQSPL